MSADEPSDLAADTAVRPGGGPGRYLAELPDAWSFRFPSGGVLATLALRAARAELGASAFEPVSATTVFCTPVPCGPIEIQVELLRRGRAAAQARATLSPVGAREPGLELLAVFGRERDGPDVLAAEPPRVPPPDEAPRCDEPDEGNPHTRYTFFANYDIRLALGDRWWTPEFRAGEAVHGRWWRYRVPQRREGGALDPLALPPVIDTMPPALIQKLGPGAPRYRAPSLDLTVHWLEETRREWLLAVSYVRRARAGNATAETEIWSDEGRLVAYGTQMMMLRRRDRK